MHVEMRHALAYPVIDAHEGPLCPQGLRDGARETAHQTPNGHKEIVGQLSERRHVSPWDNQRMAGEERAMVKQSEHLRILVDADGGEFSTADPAERALFHQRPSRLQPLN